jgi:hypothetical protein
MHCQQQCAAACCPAAAHIECACCRHISGVPASSRIPASMVLLVLAQDDGTADGGKESITTRMH